MFQRNRQAEIKGDIWAGVYNILDETFGFVYATHMITQSWFSLLKSYWWEGSRPAAEKKKSKL